MKQDVERINKILKRIAVMGGATAVLLCIGTGIWVTLSKTEGEQAAKPGESGQTMQRDTQAVLSQENAAGSWDFLNRELPGYPDDKRAVFKIIEVIPHEACSIFPYLVEWETEEEYNKNVPIGYEGLFWCVSNPGRVQMFSADDRKAGESNPFTTKKGYSKREYLSVYQGVLGDPNSGKWYRTTDTSASPWLTQTGYFEYVGEGNGLYYIPTSFKADTESESGIHYEIQAIKRTGAQNPQGEMYVKNPAYYWSKDHAASSKPDYNSKAIASMTGYNYDLSFEQIAASGTYTGDAYRADTDKLKEKTVSLQGVPTGNGTVKTYDYFLVTETPALWSQGFLYYKGGNYKVKEVTQATDGDYVRVDDNRNSDGYTDAVLHINSGYFIAHNNNPAYAGVTKYKVTFEQASSGTGYYVANAPTGNNWNSIPAAEKYHFEYLGDNKGRYDVSFIYTADTTGTVYEAKLLKVENRQGRYALTSTGKLPNGSPEYVDKDASGLPCDYSKVITNIDFINTIDYGRTDNTNNKGITLGGNTWEEWGSWVFHPITDTSEMGVTKLSSVYEEHIGSNTNTDAYFHVGDRIYVTNQKRIYRYYTRNSYVNNEWFKLLCYSDNPQDMDKPYSEIVNGVGYDLNQTAEWNLKQEAAKQLISAFDNQFRIEIVQMTPDKLTPEDVEDADLLYFSSREGVEGMSLSWNDISTHLTSQGLDALPPLGDSHKYGGEFRYTSDISNETLFAIYNACIYERTTALMVNRAIRVDYSLNPATANLAKLYYFMDYFKEAREWSYFMEDYPEYRDTYSTIRRYDGGVRAYREGAPYYNLIQPQEGTEAYDAFTTAWDPAYFEVRDINSGQIVLSGDTSFTSDGNTSTGKVYDGETKFLFEEYIVALFRDSTKMHNIWKILNNRTGVGDIVVEITNAETLADTARSKVIYANEFNPASFDVKYKVFRLGGKGAPTPLTDVTVSFEDTGTEIGRTAPAAYDTEYTTNVRSGFTIGGSADPAEMLNPSVTERKVKVIATDSAGKTGEATVTVIVREAFNLN